MNLEEPNYRRKFILKPTLIFLSILMIKPAPLSAQVADVIFFNGEIYTMDARRSWAEAVVIVENRIAFVGGNDEALKLRREGTRVVDLESRMMLPGFHDVHVHPIEAGMGYLGCSLHEGKSAEDYARLVANCARQKTNAPFIDGAGWTMDQFPNALTFE